MRSVHQVALREGVWNPAQACINLAKSKDHAYRTHSRQVLRYLAALESKVEEIEQYFRLCCCSMFGGGKKADDPYLYDTLDPLQSYPFRHLPHYNLTIF